MLHCHWKFWTIGLMSMIVGWETSNSSLIYQQKKQATILQKQLLAIARFFLDFNNYNQLSSNNIKLIKQKFVQVL